MSISDSYKHSIQQLKRKVVSLHKNRSEETKKIADIRAKINRVSEAANRTKSRTSIKSKILEIERLQKHIARSEKKIADFDKKTSKIQEQISNTETKLIRVEDRKLKQHQHNEDRRIRQNEIRMRDISSKLNVHDALHDYELTAIEKLSLLPNKITVLFLAANPIDQVQLRLDEEVRAISEMIRKSEHRDAVDLKSCWAVRPMDVLQAINEHKPSIVHFSGHGSDQGEVIFQDESGYTKPVSLDAIVQMFKACSNDIRLAFFNTCYSQKQAEAIVDHVHAAIGMKTTIGDEAARVFAAQFYSAIGFGNSVKGAFEQAIALVMMEGIPEADTPELFLADNVNGEKLIIVRPPQDEGL